MLDQVDILVTSGKGGNGSVSGRREKFVPQGGPDGGDGGNGGSVVLKCDSGINTLREYSYVKRLEAISGGNGSGRLKHGRNGDDVVGKVPIGTEIWVKNREWVQATDMTEHGQRVVVALGGKGGKGNARFASPTNRYPLLAEAGEPGQEVFLRLKLKLLADVGIIGMPNAGKSSLIAAVSAAKPRIAEYPFTTLDPVLGAVEHHNQDFVMVDIPGLIEGANKGVGLGHRFLSHIERTKVLVHLLDGASEDCLGDYHKVRAELGMFNEGLLTKPEIVAINKTDLPGVEEKCREFGDNTGSQNKQVHCISAAYKRGLGGLLDVVVEALEKGPQKNDTQGQAEGPEKVLIPRRREKPNIRRSKDGSFVVSYEPAERLAELVDGGDWDARLQLYEQLLRMGIVAALEKAGIASGDLFRIGKLNLEWE